MCCRFFPKKHDHFNLESMYHIEPFQKSALAEILKQEKGGKKDLKFAKMGEMVQWIEEVVL